MQQTAKITSNLKAPADKDIIICGFYIKQSGWMANVPLVPMNI